jgi:hypothetical protein
MISLTYQPLSFWGHTLETTAFTLNRDSYKSAETTPYELWIGNKPKLLFLRVWGCDVYVRRPQPDKLEPKAEKCVFIGYPKETVGYTFYHRSEGKQFVANNGSFLEKEFLSNGVSSRKVELDEVIGPSLHEIASGAMPKTIPVVTSPNEVGSNDENHETPKGDTTEPHRSTRIRAAPDRYSDLVMNVMVEYDDPVMYDEAMMSSHSDKWLEAMNSEMGSMYENQVWTLVYLPSDRKAIENKWIFNKKTYDDGNMTVYKAQLVAKGF